MGRCGALLLCLAACGGTTGGGDGTASSTHDSSGVRVVTSTAPAWSTAARWHVDSTPLFAVGDGARRGDPLLINVVATRFAADGEIVVITTDDAMVRWIDADGAVRASRGGFGEGPGEFRDIAFVGMVADSVVLWDDQLDRVSVMTAAPGGTRSFPLQGGDTATAPEFGYAPIELLGGEHLVLSGRRGASTNQRSGLRRDSVRFATASMDGTIGSVFAIVPGAETIVASTDRFVTMIPRPFGARTAVTTDGDEVLITVGDVDELRHYLPGTGLVRIDRLDRPRRLIAPAEIDQQGQRIGAQTSQLPKPVATAILGAMMEAGLPKVYPTYDRILTDTDHNTWLREDIGSERALDEARRWVILDKAGSWLGQVVTPPRFEVHQVTRDRVLGVWREPNGGEVVQMLRLSR